MFAMRIMSTAIMETLLSCIYVVRATSLLRCEEDDSSAYMATLVSQDHCGVFWDFIIFSMMKLLIYLIIIIVEVSFKI